MGAGLVQYVDSPPVDMSRSSAPHKKEAPANDRGLCRGYEPCSLILALCCRTSPHHDMNGTWRSARGSQWRHISNCDTIKHVTRCQLSPKMGRHYFYFVNERFRRVHAMGDVHRRADFVGGRR
jgi:hypothetical protein